MTGAAAAEAPVLAEMPRGDEMRHRPTSPATPRAAGSAARVKRLRTGCARAFDPPADPCSARWKASRRRQPEPAAAGKVTVAKKVEQKRPSRRRRRSRRRKPVVPAAASRACRARRGSCRRNIAGVFTKRKLDEDTLQDLEDVLIRADLGMETAIRVTDALASGRYGKDVSESEVRTIMAQEVEKVLTRSRCRWNSTCRTSRMSSWSSASTAPARPRRSASSRPS